MWGKKYTPDYVNNLYGMIDANYVDQFKFVCFTDNPEGIREEVEIHPIPDVEPLHPKYWFGEENYCWDRAKFLVLNAQEWLSTEGPFCYFDLDIVIQNSIDEFYELAFKPHILYSHWQPEEQLKHRSFKNIRGTYFNSSCMLWWADQPKEIYEDVIKNPISFKVFYKGSDNYHQWRRPAGANFWNFLPNDWYYSYNYQESDYNAKLALFNQNISGYGESVSLEDCEDPAILNHWYGKYDMYKELPTRVVLELTNKSNDTDNKFNDIFVEDDELTLEDVKRIFKDYKLEYVTLLRTLTSPTRCKDYTKIADWFADQGAEVLMPSLEINEERHIEELSTAEPSRDITRENIETFKQTYEYRNTEKEEQWIIDCEARNDNSIYVNAKGQVFPCSYVARDVLENRLYPLHPIDYPYNDKYNNAKSFSLKDIVYNDDFEHYNESLKRDHLKICKEKCGRCV
ncbi:hypothetical protein OAA34_00280 [bacterium]|nr:hypothetical protein [bacterium]